MAPDVLDQVDPTVLGGRLQAARKARGLTQADVAAHLDVSRTTVTAMEAGDRRVTPGELVRIAGLYGRSVGELLRREEPVEPFSVQLRSTLPPQELDPGELQESVFEFQRLCEDYVALEALRKSPLPSRYPAPYEIDSDRPEQAAEDVASRERHRLGLGDSPVWSLREILETDVGLRIFYIGMPSRVAAMFAYTQGLGGCVAVNRKHPPERRRHSLAHEYGHFLTDRYRPELTVLGRYDRKPSRERFAESFGRCFLLPETGVRRRFNDLRRARDGRVTPGDLCLLANLFCSSVQVTTLRLEELSLIPTGTWERLRVQGFKVREAQRLLDLPEPPATDDPLPQRYRLLAAEAFASGDLSEGQLARFLRLDRVSARRLVGELGRRVEMSDEGEVSYEQFDLSLPL